MTVAVSTPDHGSERDRTLAFPRQGEGGFDQCWYPVALAREVGRGEVIGRPFLDGRVAVFRGNSGAVSVLGAYCAHLGADLSKGSVVGDRLRCAFHHWEYDQSGRCAIVPSGDSIPAEARQFRFPSLERLGVIWAFNGAEPLYEFPMMDASEETHDFVAYRIRDFPMDIQTFMCNTLDFQHLRIVHGLKLEDNRDPEPEIEPYEVRIALNQISPEGYELRYRLAIHGTNIFAIRGQVDGREVKGMYAGAPLPNGHSSGFMVTCVPKTGTPEERDEAARTLEKVALLRDKIVCEDWPILSTIGHPSNALLTRSDRALGQFLRYLRQFPRAHPARRSLRSIAAAG